MRRIIVSVSVLIGSILSVQSTTCLVVELEEMCYEYAFSNELSYNINNNVLTIFSESGSDIQFIIDDVCRISYPSDSYTSTPYVGHENLKIDVLDMKLIVTGGKEGSICKIYSSDAMLIYTATITDCLEIDLQNFSKDMYIIQIDNFKPFKFLLQ